MWNGSSPKWNAVSAPFGSRPASAWGSAGYCPTHGPSRLSFVSSRPGITVTLVRTDDALDAVRQRKVDVAVVRGHDTSGTVRVVHLFNESRVAVCSVNSRLANKSELDWADVPRWPLVVNVTSGTTGPWSWPVGAGPKTIVETSNFDEWIESVAADRGIGVIPDVAVRRNIHPGVRFIALRGAPPSPVVLAFLPRAHDAALRRFVEAAVEAARHTGAPIAKQDA